MDEYVKKAGILLFTEALDIRSYGGVVRAPFSFEAFNPAIQVYCA